MARYDIRPNVKQYFNQKNMQKIQVFKISLLSYEKNTRLKFLQVFVDRVNYGIDKWILFLQSVAARPGVKGGVFAE